MIIKLPKNPVTQEEIKQRNKRLLAEDNEKAGILAKVLTFIKMYEPTSNEDLKELLFQYYKIEYDKSKIKVATKRLNDLGIVNSITSGEIMTMPPNEHSEVHKEAYKKFFNYLEHIPKQFRRNYDKVTYYWVNGGSDEYVKWACKILGFGEEND